MLGVDTNILVRFLTRDDQAQAEQAHRIITDTGNQPIRLTLIVVVELVWVLTKVKRWPSPDVFDACRRLLQSSDFVVERAALVEQCILDAEHAGCDLADAVIAALNLEAGCRSTVTFDRDAQRLTDMSAAEDFA